MFRVLNVIVTRREFYKKIFIKNNYSNNLKPTLNKQQEKKNELDEINQIKDDKKSDNDGKKKEFRYEFEDEERDINLISLHEKYFDDNIKDKNYENFLIAIEAYKNLNPNRNLYIDFIYGALLKIKEYDAHDKLETYRKLLELFPKGPLKYTNLWQRDNMHFPRHQFCALKILEEMERNKVMPDTKLGQLACDIFGDWSTVVKKIRRQLYWLPKFKYANKYPFNKNLKDPLDLAMEALKRMTTSVDIETKIFLHEEPKNDWITWSISPKQIELLKKHNKEVPIYVEGPYFIWLDKHLIDYFILKSDTNDSIYLNKLEKIKQYETSNRITFKNIFNDPFNTYNNDIDDQLNIHEQNIGNIFSICCTNTSNRQSIINWTKLLQNNNAIIKDLIIIYRIKDKQGNIIDINKN
jgi:evolutionarily conserved signaling intermediate in Toll pathway